MVYSQFVIQLASNALFSAPKSFSSSRGTNRPQQMQSVVTISGDQHQDTPVELLANYVQMNYDKQMIVFHYHVDFVPEIENFEMRDRKIKNELIRIFKDCYIYDKQNTIMTLMKAPNETIIFEVPGFRNTKVKVSIKKVGDISIGDTQMIHFLNCQLRKNFSFMPWVQILRNFYDFSKKKELREHRIQIMPGIIATIKECQKGAFLTMDTIHKVVQDETCLDYMNVCIGLRFVLSLTFPHLNCRLPVTNSR